MTSTSTIDNLTPSQANLENDTLCEFSIHVEKGVATFWAKSSFLEEITKSHAKMHSPLTSSSEATEDTMFYKMITDPYGLHSLISQKSLFYYDSPNVKFLYMKGLSEGVSYPLNLPLDANDIKQQIEYFMEQVKAFVIQKAKNLIVTYEITEHVLFSEIPQ
jgi:hypothetical protein